MKTPHTSCWTGKRVIVTLRTGEWFVDKFVARRRDFILLERRGRIATVSLRAFSIYRGQTGYAL